MTDLTERDLDAVERRLVDRAHGIVRGPDGTALGLTALQQHAWAEDATSSVPLPVLDEPADPPEERYAEDRICAECGCPWLVEVYEQVGVSEEALLSDQVPERSRATETYECRGCFDLPRLDWGGREVPHWHKLLGLARCGDGPTPDDLAALGCQTWSEAGLTEPNPRPFAHLDWPALRADAYRLWPEERFWRSPTRFAEARELASRAGG